MYGLSWPLSVMLKGKAHLITTAYQWECMLQLNLAITCDRDSKQLIKMHSPPAIVESCP